MKQSELEPLVRVPSARVIRVSEAFISTDSFELFARMQGYANLNTARAAVSRWRSDYGVDLFPYKREVSETKNGKLDLTLISHVWKTATTIKEAQITLGFCSERALRIKICRLRAEYGDRAFPRKHAYTKSGKSAANADTINYVLSPTALRIAGELWRSNVPASEIIKQLKLNYLTVAILRDIVKEHRSKHGLSIFPYRGLVIS